MSGHRVAVYYQTQYDWSHNATYVSPLPLIGLVTHLYLAAYHINSGRVGDSITLNDNRPSDSYYDQMWKDLAQVKASGIKIIGMLGGAAPGTYSSLTPDVWNTYYPDLKKTIQDYDLDGMDLDVEQSTSIDVAIRLITQLKADFGPDFIITLAPVASALRGSSNLSGFSYVDLETRVGRNISWYNAQFYSGFGSIFPDDQYVQIAEFHNGLFPPEKLVASVLTNPNLGFGYVSNDNVVKSLKDLVALYGNRFGGVAGWEYFASLPSPTPGQPWQWAQIMQNALAGLSRSFGKVTESVAAAARQRIFDRAAARQAELAASGETYPDVDSLEFQRTHRRKESSKPSSAAS